MEAVLLDLTGSLFLDGKTPLAAALRRELAAVTGMEVTALSADPAGEDCYDTLADALDRCAVLVTVGDLERPDGLRRLLSDGLGLQERVDAGALPGARAWCAAHPEADLAPEELAAVPDIAEVFPTQGLAGFGMKSREQAILCLPGDPEDFLPLLMRDGYPFLAAFCRRPLEALTLSAAGTDPKSLYDAMDAEELPLEAEYNVLRYGGGQQLRLLAPDRGLLYRAAEAAERALSQAEPAAEPEPAAPLPPDRRFPVKLAAALAVLALAGVLAGWLLLGRDGEEPSSGESSESLSSSEESSSEESSSSEEESSTYPNGMPGDYLPEFEDLYSQNEDVVGYLAIDGTDFAYPVVQYTDNDYYLHRGFDGEENESGTPFVDYRTNLRTTQNTIIYGHNMRTGTMFELLLQYRDLNFYRQHPVLEFDTVYEPGEYKVFGMFIANTREEDGPIFDYLNFLDGTEETFMEYVENVQVRSLIDTGVDVQPGDRLLTLSTCSYEFTDARFVVVARKVRDGEDPEVDTDQAVKADDPLMPRIWYELYGGNNPYETESSSSSESSSEVSSSEVSSSEPSSSKPSSSEESSSEVSSSSRPSSSRDDSEDDDHEIDDDLADETLAVTSGGRLVRMNAYDLISEIVESETRGSLNPEAIKAQVVATYTYVKYNNEIGSYPAVNLRSSVSQEVQDAVDAVFGYAMFYDGDFINAVYHSVSCGETASAESVWGTDLPYLQPVESEYDELSPYYEGSYRIDAEVFADAVEDTYGIDLYDYSDDPDDWIEIDHDHMASGDYVGRVYLGGERESQGGEVSRGKEITGRNIREQLLDYNLRSTCFEVRYNERNDEFVFETRGYGHGVGMSQWGANYLAEHDGYSWREILKHYYTDISIRMA